MARLARKTAVHAAPEVDEEKFAAAHGAMVQQAQAGALAVQEQNERVAALARSLSYSGATDPGSLENGARDAVRRIGMSIWELGAYLLLLKESCAKGEFLPALERIGLGVDVAQRYMAVTRRFSNAATSRHLESAGFSKLVEMLPLDDEQVEELTDLGQTGELALDDVARMSVKELRAAVRKERQRAARLGQTVEEQEEELRKAKRILAEAGPDEELARLRQAATLKAGACEVRIRELGGALQELPDGYGHADHAPFAAGLVLQVRRELDALVREFELDALVREFDPTDEFAPTDEEIAQLAELNARLAREAGKKTKA